MFVEFNINCANVLMNSLEADTARQDMLFFLRKKLEPIYELVGFANPDGVIISEVVRNSDDPDDLEPYSVSGIVSSPYSSKDTVKILVLGQLENTLTHMGKMPPSGGKLQLDVNFNVI